MSIVLGWGTVGGPTGMGDTQVAGQRFSADCSFQLTDLADTTAALEVALLGVNGQTCAVIAAVLETLEAFDQNGCDVTFGDGTNDSTH
ncbi:hypothetical protein D3C75_1121500 [compost metagenome]